MTNGKDILYPAELRQGHFDRMIRNMMANNKQVERLIRSVVKSQDKEVDDADR